MRSHLLRALRFVPLVLATAGLALPVNAQSGPVETLQTATQRAICLSDWNSAIQSVNQLMARTEISPAYRETLLAFRRQLEGYRSSGTRVDMRQMQECAGVSAAPSPTVTTAIAPNRPMNWERAVQNLSEANARSQLTLSTPRATTPAARSQRSAANCPSASNGDRQVASGSISNRWSYEVLEGDRHFYVRYWPQQDCNRVSRLWGTFDSPSAAQDAFVRYIENR